MLISLGLDLDLDLGLGLGLGLKTRIRISINCGPKRSNMWASEPKWGYNSVNKQFVFCFDFYFV